MILGVFGPLGFPGSSDGKESACSAGDPGSIPGLGRSLEKGMQPTPVFLPGEFQRQRSLVGYNSLGHKDSDITELLTQLSANYSQNLVV